ncbi:MAG: DNA oxidative demethylase AlkB [Proteobacteria bacterium]|nr:DNA oxidative demethylase AlkB [Pseudomonadota bacterium]
MSGTSVVTADLFEDQRAGREALAPGAVWLRGHAIDDAPGLWDGVQQVIAAAPLRHLITPGGQRMSVAMTNCGRLGWVSDRRGYRYETHDPESGHPWPAMPPAFAAVARRAAEEAGYAGFAPDACLVNRYVPRTRLSLHQDRDERDYAAPIVSVSLGLPATFLFGGRARNDKTLRVPLQHGDVVVWGGPARLYFHGVLPLADGLHPLVGAQRVNLTFRAAG